MAEVSPPRSVHGSETSEHQSIHSIRSGKNDTRVTFKASDDSTNVRKESVVAERPDPNANPFKMPPDNDIFLLRDKERQQKKQERLLQQKLKVQDKTTYAQRMNRRVASVVNALDSDDELPGQGSGAKGDQDDQKFTLEITRDRHIEKECLSDYISKKREMFLIQYSLGVKRDEMRKLEEIAAMEERKLELAEQYLEEDAALFDEFLKENDKSSGDAIKIAESETKAKLEKVAEIKKLNAQMMAVRSEISKYEDALKEYQLYRQFLESLSPKAWLQEKAKEEELRLAASHSRVKFESGSGSEGDVLSKEVSGGHVEANGTDDEKGSSTVIQRASNDRVDDGAIAEDHEENEEEPHLYFTDPQQLLDMFAELEEQNLSLIQNSQETEEALEEMKQTVKTTKARMEKETDILKEQIDKLMTAILKEEEKAKELETKARMFSYGEFRSDDQERMLAELNRKVEEVYRSCIGDNEANISTLQMLTNIENRLEDLFQQIEMMPRDKVDAAEKAKEKERRLKQREEKLEQQRLHQEERIRRALERAKAEPKRKTGRRLVPRSEPPQLKKHEDLDADAASREEEELAYYFMP